MPALLDHLRTALPQIPIREEGGELIASPASTEEVSALLTHCNTHTLPVEITGARTKRTWSGTAEAQLLLDTTRLAGVSAHPWQDLTATVAAGTPWAAMQRTLAAHNQFVALDALWPATATVGGVLATNDSGAIRLRYGGARDLVIGMTLVLADGTVAKTGGKVVKNVAGYDLHKLMIGAFGTLAVLTEVTFRLHPLPAARAAWSIPSPSIESLARLTAAISSSHLNPEALQLRTTPAGFALDVLLASTPEVLRTQSQTLHTLAGSQALTPLAGGHPPATPNDCHSDPEQSEGEEPPYLPPLTLASASPLAPPPSHPLATPNDCHSERSEEPPYLPLPMLASASPLPPPPSPVDNISRAREALFHPHRLVLKATMLPQQVPAFTREIAEKGGQSVAQSLGILYASFPDSELAFRLAEELRYHVGLQGGSSTILQRPAASVAADWSTLITQEEQPSVTPLMREIKRQFDPNRLLNRNLMGGL